MNDANVSKVAYTVPISPEMLKDAPIDFFNTPIHPRSPLQRAAERVADAEADLEEAEENLHYARQEYERVAAEPGSDVVVGEPQTINEMLHEAIGRGVGDSGSTQKGNAK